MALKFFKKNKIFNQDAGQHQFSAPGNHPFIVAHKASFSGPQKNDVLPDYFESDEGFRDLVDFIDNRTPVSDSRKAPYGRICLIQSFDRGVDQAKMSGTGFLINRHTVLTAAHVVFDNERIFNTGSPKAERVDLWFGFDQKFGEPTGIYGTQKSTEIIVHPRYEHNFRADCDIAIIQLQNPVGDCVGWLTPHIFEEPKLDQVEILISGYPGETKMRYTPYEHREIISAVREKHFYHKVDTSTGQSGAPVIMNDENSDLSRVAGIHTRNGAKALDDIGEKHNYAVRFRDDLFDWLKPQTK